MSVVGTYTPATNFNIETVFTPDAAMDNNAARGCTMWEFKNANFYHALIFTAFKWEWRTEQFIAGNWVKKWIDFDLDGVADTPFGYAYYKENLVPITITTTYDYTNQERRIYVDGYLLTTDVQNIPAINQALTLSIYTGIPSDKFNGTINTITYAATAPSPTPLPNPIPQVIITDYNKKYVPYSQNWFPVDDVLTQYQKWADPQFNITTNCWVEAAYDIQYLAGYDGSGDSPNAGILAKMLLIQGMLSSNKFRHSVRFAVLQPAWDGKALPVNTWKTLIGFANANPLVRAILGASVAQVVPISPDTKPNLHTVPVNTPVTAFTGIRNTFYKQIQYILTLLTRPINGCYVDDEDFSTNTNLQTMPSLAGVNTYVNGINYMFGTTPYQGLNTLRGSCPATMEFIIYDMFDLQHCVSLNQFPFNPLVNVNSTGNASISQYTDRQKFWFLHQGAIRSLRFYLVSKYYEIQAGRQLNQVFVQGGRTYEEDCPRPGSLLGLWKMYKICGAERLFSSYFTPSSIGIQEPKAYCWQAAAASYVEAIFTKPQYRNILLYGTLLDGDVLEDPANPPSHPLYLFDCGNKLVAVSARKYNGEYLIGCTYQPLNNFAGQAVSKTITVTIDGNVLTLEARKQGSVYHRDTAGTLTWIDEWHEDTHFDWWGNVIINPNLNTDMAGINDLHNGYGYIYKTTLDTPTPIIVGIQRNDEQGEREMRRQGMTDAPIGADSSATGLIKIVSCASVGFINTVVIDGNDILNATPYPIATNVPATEAEGLALWINGITPAAGYRYFAFSVGDTVYLESPIDVGLLVNDLTITVTVSVGSIVTLTTPFFNGTSATEVYDSVTGYKYFLNADYDANGTTNTLAAPPNSLTNAIDITKWMITRGNNSGMMEKSITIASDAILSADRGSQNMLMELTGEGSAADVLVYIAPNGFVQGDLLYLKNAITGADIVLESAPITTSPSPFKNIYLAQNQPYTLTDALNSMVLQYTYDENRGGGIFVELTRSFVYVPPADDCLFNGLTYAQAATLAGANGLRPCASYEITNRGDLGVILKATSVSTFDIHAIHIADYRGAGQVGGTPQEICEYDFVGDRFLYRADARENCVRWTSPTPTNQSMGCSNWWGYANKIGNILVTPTITGAHVVTLNMQSNSLVRPYIAANGAAAVLGGCTSETELRLNIGAGALISNCMFLQCQYDNPYNGVTFNAGANVQKTTFSEYSDYITFASTAVIVECTLANFPRFDFPVIIDGTQSNKIIDGQTSSFTKNINPNGSGNLILGADTYLGIITQSATGVIEQICVSTGDYTDLYYDVIIKPDSTHTTTLVDTTNAGLSASPNVRLDAVNAATDIILDDAKGDWAWLRINKVFGTVDYNKYRLMAYQNY